MINLRAILQANASILTLIMLMDDAIGQVTSNQWKSLLDKDLSQWEVFMGVPHTSVDLTGVVKSDDVREGVPMGLNNDPKQVFSTIVLDGDTVLKVSGEIYGGLTTKQEFSNYHLKLFFKWGEKKWEPRLEDKRDSGILYHCNGPHGVFWNVWMSSLECQVQETDCGDFIALGEVYGDVPSTRQMVKGQERPVFTFEPGGSAVPLKWAQGFESGMAAKRGNYEKANGEWNCIEVLCLGGESLHVVNGRVVNRVINARHLVEGKEVPVTRGKIQIQSEAAEIFYRNIMIAPIEDYPKIYKSQLGL